MRLPRVQKFQGVILIVSLLLVMTIAFLGRAAIALNPGLLALSSQNTDSRVARTAADSGLDYALNRLRDNPAWRGQANAVVVDTPSLFVQEQNGNVVGLITNSKGEISQFRLRFNYQDGDGGADSMNDPEAEFWVDHPFVSLNNTSTPGHAILPRGDGANWEVQDPASGPHEIPGQSVAILVEGRSGPGLQNHERTNPNAALNGPVKSEVVESTFQLGFGGPVAHAAVMGGSDVVLTTASSGQTFLSIDGDTDDSTPRIRSKGSVIARDESGGTANIFVDQGRGEIGRDSAGSPGFEGNFDGFGADLVDESVGDGSDFYNLEWSDVTQASSDPADLDTVRIPAGTYVAWDDNSVHYYDMSYQQYQQHISDPANFADPGTTLTPGFRQIRDPANYAAKPYIGIRPDTTGNGDSLLYIQFNDDTRIVESATGKTEFNFTTRRGAKSAPDNDSLFNSGAADGITGYNVLLGIREGTLSAPGDVNILTRLVGNSATITSEGDFNLVTPFGRMQKTWNDPEAAYGLNLYVQGDISMSGYRDWWNNYSEIVMSGLVYSWGDVKVDCGHSSLPTHRWRDARFSGTVVAYGSEPGVGTPGSNGKGRVELTGSDVRLSNNVDSVASVIDTDTGSASVTFKSTLYTTH